MDTHKDGCLGVRVVQKVLFGGGRIQTVNMRGKKHSDRRSSTSKGVEVGKEEIGSGGSRH